MRSRLVVPLRISGFEAGRCLVSVDDRPVPHRVHQQLGVTRKDSPRRLGRDEEALPLFDQAMAACPAMFRLLDVRLPISVQQEVNSLDNGLFAVPSSSETDQLLKLATEH